MIKHCIRFCCTLSLITLSVHAATEITQHGITWKFDTDVETGQFANGDYWVVGPVNITTITNSYHTYGFTPASDQDGSMINPPTTNKQGYEGALTTYDSSLNVSHPGGNPISATNPLALSTNSSLISSVSWLYNSESDTEPGCPSFNGGTHTPRPTLRTAAVLTCLDSAPAAGSFRPPYCGNDKTIKFNKSDLDYASLKNLAPVASTLTLSDMERAVERLWIDHIYQYAGAYLHPSENMPEYGAELSKELGKVALMLHLDFNQLPGSPSKETLLIRFVQIGIDFAGIADNGGSWPSNGGHLMGRKWPILFAGIVLGDAHMGNVGHWTTAFQEDYDTFYISQAEVDMTHSPAWNPDHRAPPMPYETEHIGMPEWGIRHRADPWADNLHWLATYRTMNNPAYVGFVLAAQIMGQKTAWNHNALFDYVDRATANGFTAYTPGTYHYSHYVYGGVFVENMWTAYRSEGDIRWVAKQPHNPTDPDDPDDDLYAGSERGARIILR